MSKPSPNRTILIVDDNVGVTKALTSLIRTAGYDAVGWHSAAEALQWAQNATPAAAVLDIHLPDINGLILAQKLREQFGPQTPIIVVSGDTSMETLNSLPHVGATYFFSKPLSSAMLLERLGQLVGGGQTREAG